MNIEGVIDGGFTMRLRNTTYVNDVRHRTMNVLSTIFNGDMIQVWAAYIAIYPKQKNDIDKDALNETMKLSRTLYK